MTTQNTNVQIQIITTPEKLQSVMNEVSEKALTKAWERFKEIINSESHPLLSRKEAANYLNISLPTLRSLTASGQIPEVKIGRSVKYKLEDLDKFTENKK